MNVLAGDLGGTHARFGIAEFVEDRVHFILTCRLASAKFSELSELVAQFRAEAGTALDDIDAACLAIAGPVSPDGCRARFTNLPWQADADALSGQLGMPVRLTNDFAAIAAGIDNVPASGRVTLQAGDPAPSGVRLAIGAGTGLGVCALLGTGPAMRLLPGEGGHIGFSPQDPTQQRIHDALRARRGRVTAESIVSGPGLTALHEVLAGESLDPATIAMRAIDGDARCRATTDAFFGAYGAVAGDLAMAFLARGGVYLAGGVTQKLLPLLADSPFLANFRAKAEHADLVATMPVHVVTDPDIGLAGAARLALADPSG